MALRLLFLLSLGVLGTYLLFVGWIFLNQRSLQYFNTNFDSAGKGDGKFLPWHTRDGLFIGYLRMPASPKSLLLVFHGNGGEALDRIWFGELVPPEVGVLLAEYPGYGAKLGDTNEQAIFEEALKVFDEAVHRWAVPMVVLGESLGSGVACYVAGHRNIAKLALVSPFTSALEVALYHYPFVPVRLLMKDRYHSQYYLREVKVPLYIIHGQRDKIIPIEMAQRLFAEYRGPVKAFTGLREYAHNDIAGGITTSPEAESFRTFLRH